MSAPLVVHENVRKGDMFRSPTGHFVRVTRVGKAGWVDIDVLSVASVVGHVLWSKRMPLGIPSAWERQ